MFNIIYIDDEPDLLLLGKTYLELSGHLHVETATDAREAFDRLRHKAYDGIISDFQMPGMTGIELLREIRRNQPDIPFILFTGRSREEIVVDALNSGADFYLQKGGDAKAQFTELEHKIRNAIERRTTRDELRESRQRTMDLINFLPDATFAINRRKEVIAWNRAMEAMTGVPDSRILGTGDYSYALPFYGERRPVIIDLVLSRDPDIAALYPSLEQQGDRFISEAFVPTLNGGRGAHVWLTASPLYDSRGNITGAIAAIRDITGRKEAEERLKLANEDLHSAYEQLAATEEELRENFEELARSQQDLRKSEERYRDLIEGQAEFICRFTPGGMLTFANEEYCRYFSLDKDTCTGKLHVVVLPPEDRRMMRQHLSSLTPGLPVGTIEHRIIMPSGEVRWQEWSDRAVFNTDGVVTEYQSVGRDVTMRKQVEAALQVANRKLNLLSSITRHDILNQVTILQGALGLLEIKTGDPDQLQWILRAVLAGKRIQGQIAFTKQYQDIGAQKPRWQNLYGVVMTVRLDGSFSAVSIDRHLERIEVFADPLFRTVFFNLFENTAMHGGAVTQIAVSGTATPECFTLVVEDNGDGIAPEDKNQIFQKGFGKNTGLGLFLAQEVLAITGLTIRETGEFGKGARFEILVPNVMFRYTPVPGR